MYFSLMTDVYTQALGQIWALLGAIPMGGPLSTQSADLRSVWGAKTRVDVMQCIGQLSFSLRVRRGTCMTHSAIAMGFTTHLHGSDPPLIYAQPSGLISTWHLKNTVTLQTPRTNAHKQISNIIVGAMLNVQPFLHTWIARLLSITAWAQMACLSGYSNSTVLRALHSAVPRIISRTLWDVEHTL